MITNNARFFKNLPSWIYKPAAQLWIDKKFPRHIFIETTANCNLECTYCPREKIRNHMDFGLFRRIVDEATHHGPRSFSLHLFGEPLLYPYFYEAIQYIKSKNKHHTVLLTTNGTLLERNADKVIGSGVDKVIWSWRPEAKFTDKFKERLKKWGKFTVRMINETVPKEEKEYWENWPNVETRRIHNYGGNVDTLKFGAKNISGTRYPCYHLWLAPAVAWNGKFLMCCADPHQKEILGDVQIETVSEAWQRVERVRQSHLKGNFSGICKDCDVWKEYPNLFFGHEFKTSEN